MRLIQLHGEPKSTLAGQRTPATARRCRYSHGLMLQLKCDGLDAGQLARRAVAPSTTSLLGLVRHMAEWNVAGSAAGSPGST